jgi:hypothetical protein
MKTEKQIHPINMRQYRSCRIIRIVLRCFGIYLAGSALFAAAFQIGNRAVAESRVGILIWLVCSFLCGGILLTLSFFVPKLPRYRDTIGAGSPVCAGCSTRLSDLKDTEILIADGKRYCDVCAKRYMEGDLKKPVQEPVYKREQTYTCARCKKQIGEQDCVWIGDHRFCRDCANAANQIILKAERYKEPKYREPIGPTGLCSRCRSRVPLTELVFKDLTDCICRSCYQKIKRFPILHLYFNPCMQYEDCENLDVCVAKDGYVVNHYGFDPGDGHYFVLPTGFFANASWDAIAAILNAASPSGRGFGFGKKKRLSADDIKNNEEIRKLIDYDRERSTSHNNKCLGKPENNQSVRVNKLQKALENDEFLSFVKGEGDYFYDDRDRYRQGTTETSLVEYDIYKYYENCPDSHIDRLWENTLLDLLNSSEYDMMLSFEYFGGQFRSEVSGLAPFRFHPESYRTLQTVIEKNQKKLLKYKEWYEFGNYLAGGAYEWAQSVGQFLNIDYRKTGRAFAMHDDHGTRYEFRIHERKSEGGGGRSGYGWRDWLFFCHENDVPYLLQYNDCSEGCGWFAVPLSQEDVLKIVQGPDEEDERSDKNAAYWLWFRMLSEHLRKENVIRYLHPDDIAEARELLDGGFSFHGKLTDEEIAGSSGNPQSKTKES